jgi:hypothetical protein
MSWLPHGRDTGDVPRFASRDHFASYNGTARSRSIAISSPTTVPKAGSPSKSPPRPSASRGRRCCSGGPGLPDRTRHKEFGTVAAAIKQYIDPAALLEDAAIDLSPTVADLAGSDGWPFPPTPVLLAAARQNSKLSAWLAALPLLSRSIDSQIE